MVVVMSNETSEQRINRTLDAMGTLIPEVATSNDLSVLDRLLAVAEVIKNDVDVMVSVERFQRYVHVNVRDAKVKPADDIKSVLTDLFIDTFLQGLCEDKRRPSKPKVHHWIPVCYLQQFKAPNTTATSKVRCHVRASSFNGGKLMSFSISDSNFAHKVVDNKGFNDYRVERFYAGVEMFYGSSSAKGFQGGLSNVSVAALALVQSVRSPHPATGFLSGDVKSILGATLKALDAWDEVHAWRMSVSKKDVPSMGFMPYVPARIRHFTDGSEAFYFPVSPKAGFVISSKHLSMDDRNRVQDEYIARMGQEIRSGRVAFGVWSEGNQIVDGAESE